MTKCRKLRLLGIVLLVTLFHFPALAQEGASAQLPTPVEQPNSLNINRYGLTARLTTQDDISGVNFSVMPSWNPNYQLNPTFSLEAQVGGTFMRATSGNFPVMLFQVGISVHNLAPDLFEKKDRIVPEILVGAENWLDKDGGTFMAASFNLRYRFDCDRENRMLKIDSVHIGYQLLNDAPSSARQFTLGAQVAL